MPRGSRPAAPAAPLLRAAVATEQHEAAPLLRAAVATEQHEAAPLLRAAVPTEQHYAELIPCQTACPVHTDARGYVRAIAEGRFEEAYLIARGPNPFASICGRVCGAPCEAACRRGQIPITDPDGRWITHDLPVSIRALKRFACDRAGIDRLPPEQVWDELREYVPPVVGHAEEMAALLRSRLAIKASAVSNSRVAIIGSGPAGLSAAHDLALMGAKPTVYELEDVPAGMLVLGIPEFRLPRALIAHEVAVIEALGVELRCGVEVGKDISFAELREQHDAVIIAVGAKRPRLLGLPGEPGPGVFGGVDFLRAVALGESPDVGNTVAVVGGGNVAYDVARTVLRQVAMDTARTVARLASDATVTLVSLETLEEMPADTDEIRAGDQEGIGRLDGFGPVQILRSQTGVVEGLIVKRCLRVFDEDGRFAPCFDDEDVRTVACDTIMMATGQTTDLGFLDQGGQDIEHARPGWPKVDSDTLETTGEGVFVAGDLAHGTRLLIDAVASGKRAARSVYQYLTGKQLSAEAMTMHAPVPRYRREPGYEHVRRVAIPVLVAGQRLDRPHGEVELGYDEAQAREEASRCLDCGVSPVFDGTRCVLCGGCVEVCPTSCLKLVPLDRLEMAEDMAAAVEQTLGADVDRADNTAILKDEDRCIRCGMCAMRCAQQAITMERFSCETNWRLK